jgi:hypothetical protein
LRDQFVTVVVALAVLLAVFGSRGDAAVTVAVLVSVPGPVGLTVILTVADPPLAIVPRLHVTIPLALAEHVP